MIMYQGYCNDCGWYGKGETDAAAARWDAMDHQGQYQHDNVEVQRPPSDGHPMFVMWTPTDGRGEDGEIHIH
jgi:hypothetical protein